MDSTLGDHDFYNLDLLPSWKLEIWRKISEDATEKGAFPKADYFDDGLLKPHVELYQPLFTWVSQPTQTLHCIPSMLTVLQLHRKTSPKSMEDLEPMWEYRDDFMWRLMFIDTDEWLEVRHDGPDRAYTAKKLKRRQAQLGGLFIEGNAPR